MKDLFKSLFTRPYNRLKKWMIRILIFVVVIQGYLFIMEKNRADNASAEALLSLCRAKTLRKALLSNAKRLRRKLL